MIGNKIVLPFKEGIHYNLYTLADVHAGNANSMLYKVEEKVEEIRTDPFGLLSVNGDMADHIPYTDKRFDPTTIDDGIIGNLTDLKNMLDIYIDYLTQLLEPVKDKIICVTTGGHEQKIVQYHRKDPLYEVCNNLGILERWGGWACITTLNFRDDNEHHDNFDIFQSHGWQASRKGGAIVNNLDDMMGWIDCDLLLQAHSHQYIIKHKVKLYSDNGHIKHKTVIGAHTGGWLLTYKQPKDGETFTASYAEKAGYPPTVIGSPTFKITPTRYGHGQVSVGGGNL